ncbi:hypothetical protein ACNUDN_02460 [Mycobacterium sp. smrl_JER01]|uniref:hypothetical protein n=1 Tax=Mycobacterium sp. smrl_JER01 TaxID=3402633 RepID=UPI003AD53C5E
MIAFWIAVIVGGAVAIVYVALAVQAFTRVRRDILTAQDGLGATGEPAELAVDAPDTEVHGVFTWKAGIAVVTSTTVIALLGVNAAFWYLPPVLAIGTAVAVAAAFLIDRGAPRGASRAGDESSDGKVSA